MAGQGREVQKGGDICILVTDSCCLWQKPTQHCKVIVLQLKIKFKKWFSLKKETSETFK